ncbi:MAG: hypothetical protein H9535_12760 [Ignavibacteria bacterium]|nr:hypothetical protein [Ignavibacteria bacterium]
MYTSHIGKRFVQLYNEREKKALSAEEYFDKEFFSLFYDHGRYLQSPASTPLFQLIAQKKTHDSKARLDAKVKLSKKIIEFMEKNGEPEMSFGLGYASADDMGTTSAQITSLRLPVDGNDMYASWVGAGFGIGLPGGLAIAFDRPEILGALAEGWTLYREFVNQTEGLENKVDTWNGIWLTHRFDEFFNPTLPKANFQPVGSDGAMERPDWTDIVFALAQQFPFETLTGYVYSFGQMNKTVGFVRLALPEVGRFWKALFGNTTTEQRKALKTVYTTRFGVSAAIERFSTLGLRAMEPKDLQKYMLGREVMPALKNDDKSQLTYKTYIAWISAMLNNQQLLDLAQEAAQTLHAYTTRNKDATTGRGNRVDELLSSANRKRFIDTLTDIVNDDASIASVSDKLVHALMMDIPLDNVPLFVTLVRFKYALPQVKN